MDLPPPPGSDDDARPSLPTTPEARAAFIRDAQEHYKRSELRRLFKAELLASPAFAAHMAPYNPRGFDGFSDNYASYKADTYLDGPRALEAQEGRFLEFRRDAAEKLWEIQQKKLFDLQCQWRAEQLTLPGIRHSKDFDSWSRYIDHCPLITPITADEVARYEAYLRSDTFDPEAVYDWQNYEDFKLSEDPDRQQEADAELPAWYAFHNARTGAGALLSLPDRRTPKEARYVNLWRDDRNEKRAASPPAGEPDTEKMPWPPHCIGLDAIGPFFDLFEPAAELPRLHRWRRAAEREGNRSSWELEQAEYWYTCVLHPAAEAWPIKANADWRVALREAGYDYWRTQMADLLAEVWHEQEQNRALGLPVVPPDNAAHRAPFNPEAWAEDSDWYTQAILRGRELAGETRDFDF